MATLSSAEVEALQHALNRWTDKYLAGFTHLRVDGDKGIATNKRIRQVKWYMGYVQAHVNSGVGRTFLWRLQGDNAEQHRAHKGGMGQTHARLKVGKDRRVNQRAEHRKNQESAKTHGVGTFDGHPVANWIIPYLDWAREHGWQGRLVSGWRDPVYSEHLCYGICGRPRCPGLCAGRASNHSGSDKPHGAVDVTYYVEFGDLMARAPFSPHLINRLARDKVHYSVSGG